MDFPLGNSELQEAVKTSPVGTSVHYIQPTPRAQGQALAPERLCRSIQLYSAFSLSPLSLPSPEPISLAGIESGLGMLPVW